MLMNAVIRVTYLQGCLMPFSPLALAASAQAAIKFIVSISLISTPPARRAAGRSGPKRLRATAAILVPLLHDLLCPDGPEAGAMNGKWRDSTLFYVNSGAICQIAPVAHVSGRRSAATDGGKPAP
jgi:hypothetical protein